MKTQISNFCRLLKCCRLTKPKSERDQKDWICDRNNGFASKENLNRLSLKKIWRYFFTKNFIFLEEINNYRKNIVIDPKFSNFFDPKWYQFYINDPECIVCSPYFVMCPLFCAIFGFWNYKIRDPYCSQIFDKESLILILRLRMLTYFYFNEKMTQTKITSCMRNIQMTKNFNTRKIQIVILNFKAMVKYSDLIL